MTNRLVVASLLMLLPAALSAQSFVWRISTVAQLPALCEPGRSYIVSDATAADTCTGGGTVQTVCICNTAGNGYVGLNFLPSTSSATPTIAFNDSDSVASPPDDNATISANLTDAGDGTEDADLDFQVQVAGVLTSRLYIDADALTEIRNSTLQAGTGGAIVATDLAAGGVDATTEVDGALCGTNQILEDQGASWACINTPSGGGGATGRIFTLGQMDAAAPPAFQPAANECECSLFVLPVEMTDLDRVEVIVATADGTNVEEIGIYSLDGATQYFECTIGMAAASYDSCINDNATPSAMTANEYWFCYSHDASSTARLEGAFGNNNLRGGRFAQTCTAGEMPATLTSPTVTWGTGGTDYFPASFRLLDE